MPAESPRSRAVLAKGFATWFAARHPEHSDLAVEVNRPQPGLSSDTLMLHVTHSGGEAQYVARLPALGGGLFPDYDLDRQARVQRSVGEAGIAVAEPLALEHDESWVGSQFLLMPRVAGHTLTTSPPYPTDGWLAQQSAADQRSVILRFVELLATVHRTHFDDEALGTLTGGGPDLASVLDYWDHYLDWATDDAAAAGIYRRSLRWCRDHLPAEPPPPCLLWGDPQLTNLVIDDDGNFAAVLDWEMSGRGPAELDLAWFLVLHEHATETAGAALPGDPGRAAILDTYAAALRRELADLEWYEVLANIRSGAIVLRIGALMQQAGHSPSWTALVPQPRHLAELIGA
jgi:aminoglycoside phosphotransferase (APT) family kinase protein